MIKINGKMQRIDSINLLEYLRQNGYRPEVVAVELNGEIVPKSAFSTTTLKHSDSVEIVSFVGGG